MVKTLKKLSIRLWQARGARAKADMARAKADMARAVAAWDMAIQAHNDGDLEYAVHILDKARSLAEDWGDDSPERTAIDALEALIDARALLGGQDGRADAKALLEGQDGRALLGGQDGVSPCS